MPSTDRVEPNQEVVAQWFETTYAHRGFRYLRPFDAYPIYLQLLGAEAGKSLLDVACGPGLLLEAARMKGLRPTGVDISSTAVAIARDHVRGAEVIEGNAEDLALADGRFDYVTCIGAIERFLDRERALREIVRVARDDARFCFLVRNASSLGWTVWCRWLHRQNHRAHQDALTLDAWRKLFRDGGLVIESTYMDQWPRQRLRRLLRGFRRHDFRRPEPIARPVLPIRFANEFIFILRKANERGEAGS